MTLAGRVPRDAQLLAGLSEALSPDRAPFYVCASRNGHPDGWYWVPAGAERPVYLGRNVMWAQRRLLSLVRNGNSAAL